MSFTSSAPGNFGGSPEKSQGGRAILVAVLAHVLIWSLGPALLFGNLHADTLEAAYWGRDLALGYSKHPPLATWMIDAVLRLGAPPVFSLMLLSQAGMAVAACFLWKSVRMFASNQTAGFAVLLFLASPAATLYAVQMNHNSLLAPFWGATLWFGLSFLEERRLVHAIGLGIVAGLGLVTKYEIVFLLASLVVLALATPRFRPAFACPASYVSVALFMLVAAPHVWWLQANGWPSMARALGAEKISNAATLNLSGVNAIVAMFTLFVSPVAILLATLWRRAPDDLARGPDLRGIALVLAFAPVAVLLLGGLASMQVLKPLWVLPLASSTAAGMALAFPAGSAGEGLGERASARILAGLSACLFAGFAIYLFVAGALGKPLAAYSADGRKLAAAVEALWASRQTDPLRCVVIAERKIGPSGVLFLKGRPDFVDFSSVNWASPRQITQCRRTGAVAVLAEPSTALDNFPAACRAGKQIFDLPTMPGMGGIIGPVELVYIPPEGTATCDAPAR